MFTLARVWKVLPSQLMRIDDAYTAYCFDEAVTEFGFSIQNELDKIKGKNEKSVQGQRDALLRRLLGDAPAQEAKYAVPVATRAPGKPKRKKK